MHAKKRHITHLQTQICGHFSIELSGLFRKTKPAHRSRNHETEILASISRNISRKKNPDFGIRFPLFFYVQANSFVALIKSWLQAIFCAASRACVRILSCPQFLRLQYEIEDFRNLAIMSSSGLQELYTQNDWKPKPAARSEIRFIRKSFRNRNREILRKMQNFTNRRNADISKTRTSCRKIKTRRPTKFEKRWWPHHQISKTK